MTTFQGLYKAEFGTGLGSGSGVVWLENGHIHGGDSSMYYVGTYSISGEKITGTFITKQHSVGVSVLGQANVQVNFTGTIAGTTAVLNGSPVGAPSIKLNVKLSPLS